MRVAIRSTDGESRQIVIITEQGWETVASRQNRKVSDRRGILLSALAIAGRESSTATVMFHTAIAERAGLTATDAKAMDILTRHGALTAGELSEHTGLATASVTSLIDRLEARGRVRRVRDRADRRRVIVEPVREKTEGDASFFRVIQSEFEKLVEDLSDRQLETILELMRRMTERTHAITAELTGTREAGRTTRSVTKKVQSARQQS